MSDPSVRLEQYSFRTCTSNAALARDALIPPDEPIDDAVTFERALLWETIHVSAAAYRAPIQSFPVPHSGAADACRAAADQIEAELHDIGGTLAKIGDRQRILTGAIATVERQTLPAIGELIDAARASILDEDFDRASARLQAALIMTQLEKIEASYLAVADYADDHGFPSQATVAILSAMNRALTPLADAARTLDPDAMSAALADPDNIAALAHAAELAREWATRLEDGWEFSRKAIAAIDAATLVLSAYRGFQSIAGSISSGGPSIAGITAGGVATGARMLVNAEFLESIRHLIEIGALSNVVLSSNTTTVGPLSAPAPNLALTPTGIVVPTKGPYKGKEVRFGDARNKHTKVATYTLQEILNALRNPKRAKGELGRFVEAVKAGNARYGSQLSREGLVRYEQLVKDGLENGRPEESGSNPVHTASFEIGFDVTTGRPTARYRVDGAPHSAHIIPYEPK